MISLESVSPSTADENQSSVQQIQPALDQMVTNLASLSTNAETLSDCVYWRIQGPQHYDDVRHVLTDLRQWEHRPNDASHEPSPTNPTDRWQVVIGKYFLQQRRNEDHGPK